MGLLNFLWNYVFPAEQPKNVTLVSRKTKLQIEVKPTYLLFVNRPGDEGRATIHKWKCLKQEIFSSLFENKPGCWLTFSNEDFVEEAWGTFLEKTGDPDTKEKTYIMAKDRWARDDLNDLVSSWQFDVDYVWMRPGMDEKAANAMTSAEVADFQKFIKEFHSLGTEIESHPGGVEVIGGYGDGDNIFWRNPSPENVSLVMERLKKLASDLDVEIEECIDTC